MLTMDSYDEITTNFVAEYTANIGGTHVGMYTCECQKP